MEKQEQLIVIKQLPIIEEQLKNLSEEIDKKVERAMKLVVSDETVKEVKKVLAELNNEFKELETQRKYVKEKILTPYNQFEETYKEYVSIKYKTADETLKNKINEVEEQKAKKEQEVKDYYTELCYSEKLEWLCEAKYYELADINITLSASLKSLKEKANQFVERVKSDLKLIDTQEHKAEIIVEYKQTLNVSQAITTVTNRFKAIEEEKKKEEQKVVHIEMNENHEITKESYEQLEESSTEDGETEVKTEEIDTEEDVDKDTDIIGTLTIEKIGLNGKVKEGSTSSVLENYIGHIEETSKYDGNVGLAAHNRGNKYSYFARINELDNGDEIKYQTQYGQRTYVVNSKKEILETDWNPLKSTKENKLTLITCIKNKVNQRLCVEAVEKN